MPKSNISPTLFSWKLLLALISFQLAPNSAYNVARYGARGDGRTDSTAAFQRAWSAACSSARPASVSVPRGTFVVGPLSFTGPCRNRILFEMAGTIVAPDNYYAIGNSPYWILFYRVSGLTLVGGTIDARGSEFWSCRRGRYNRCPGGARTMHVTIGHSSNIRLRNVRVTAPSGSPNTDGIHIASSRGVTVTDTIIKTGDDCVSIGPGSMNVWLERIGCGPGHGISVGSLGDSYNEDGVQNVTVTNSVFTKTQNGVRVKSWARRSVGYARNLVFSNLVMRNVANPIIIDQMYCPTGACPHQSSGVRVSQVLYRDIKGTSSTQAAMTFRCNPSNPCYGIRLQDVRLTYVDTLRRPTVAYCENARASSRGSVFPRGCW
ncbi:pectin lyase-like superfamily protein [Striga asiatica]|uniref:Pectin lyase-like superfamily protein n=1 Tax=Striga asiatica TaxID=4170 RepID=A0A5A7PNH6_STRAF|nr:pectin lyase-like superfamily protein [Striga asiatica]